MSNEVESRRDALVRILSTTSQQSARVATYAAALLGIAALVPTLELPPEIAAIAGGIGVEAMGSLLDRASSTDMSNEELYSSVMQIVSKGELASLLTKDDFYHAFAHLRKRQNALAKQNSEILNLVRQMDEQYAGSTHEVKNDQIGRQVNHTRGRRLRRDIESMIRFQEENPALNVAILDETYMKFRINYALVGIGALDVSGKPIFADNHEVELTLHERYPLNLPFIQFNTSIFHPNIFPMGDVCMGWFKLPYNLVDVCIRIGKMIEYQVFDTTSPANWKAAQWVKNNPTIHPLGNWYNDGNDGQNTLVSDSNHKTDSGSKLKAFVDTIKVEIVSAQSGEVVSGEVSLDMGVKYLIEEVNEHFSIPERIENKWILEVELYSVRQKRFLDKRGTLRENDVMDGDVFHIQMHARGG